MVIFLLFALLGTPQDASGADASISKVVERHFSRWEAPRRAEVAAELQALWRTLPEGDLRERGLMRIVRTVETATYLFPRDQEFKNMKMRHPELPELAVPDAFHMRAYELAARQLKVLVGNAAAYPSRTPETREEIADQIQQLFDRAVEAFVARAADGEAEKLILEILEKRRGEFIKAMDDPFSGYQKALEPKQLKELTDRIVRTAGEMPKFEFDGSKAPKDKRGRPVRDAKPFLDAVLVVHDVARAYNPARFAIYHEVDSLNAEVHADWKERKKKSEKAYNEKAGEEFERDRDPDRH